MDGNRFGIVRYLAVPFTALTLALSACVVDDSETPRGDCATQANDTPQELLACMTTAGVRAHLVALADIAATHGGDRAAGTPGYAAAVDYARRVFAEAGYAVTVQPFDITRFVELSPSVLEERAPASATIGSSVFQYSPRGDVTASVGVPLVATGCAAADFAGFAAGRIALIRRGNCAFVDKAQNAQLAGAAGVVVYNNVDSESNSGTLGTANNLLIPVLGVSLAEGLRLAGLVPQGLVLHMKADTRREIVTTFNVLAESASGRDDAVIIAGAHLDSVAGTAGIDDNGSGVAGILETARQMGRIKPLNKLRFALWGAEEIGLDGSGFYVAHLTPVEKAGIAAYLNFDMIAAPNYGFFVFDSDGSDSKDAVPVPPGSAAIEASFAAYYAYRGIPIKPEAIESSSDQWSFFAAGIPVGGMNTGASALKTSEEVALWGGTVGKPFDGCYHKPCDDLANVSDYPLGVNAGAIAWTALALAMNPWTYPRTASHSDVDLKRLPIARFKGSY